MGSVDGIIRGDVDRFEGSGAVERIAADIFDTPGNADAGDFRAAFKGGILDAGDFSAVIDVGDDDFPFDVLRFRLDRAFEFFLGNFIEGQ